MKRTRRILGIATTITAVAGAFTVAGIATTAAPAGAGPVLPTEYCINVDFTDDVTNPPNVDVNDDGSGDLELDVKFTPGGGIIHVCAISVYESHVGYSL